MEYFSVLWSINYLEYSQEQCFVMDRDSPQQIEEKCSSIGGYLPKYADIIQPRINGTFFDRLIVHSATSPVNDEPDDFQIGIIFYLQKFTILQNHRP